MQHPLASAPTSLQYWLRADGSLTALLEAKAGQALRVQRIFEGYRPLTLAQKKQLGYRGYQLGRPMLGWVREVLLYGNDEQPWVLAHSIFPAPSLQGDAKRLKQLQNMPIGYVLFKRQASLPSQRSIQRMVDGWQRQTLYHWQGRPLLIGETFLDGFL